MVTSGESVTNECNAFAVTSTEEDVCLLLGLRQQHAGRNLGDETNCYVNERHFLKTSCLTSGYYNIGVGNKAVLFGP